MSSARLPRYTDATVTEAAAACGPALTESGWLRGGWRPAGAGGGGALSLKAAAAPGPVGPGLFYDRAAWSRTRHWAGPGTASLAVCVF